MGWKGGVAFGISSLWVPVPGLAWRLGRAARSITIIQFGGRLHAGRVRVLGSAVDLGLRLGGGLIAPQPGLELWGRRAAQTDCAPL